MATGAGTGAGGRRTDDARGVAEAVGSPVRDEATGRVGILQDVLTFRDISVPPHLPPRTRTLAYIRPEGGGREWTTEPDRVTVLRGGALGDDDGHGDGTGPGRESGRGSDRESGEGWA